MAVKLYLVAIFFFADGLVSATNTAIGTIDANIVIEQYGAQLSTEPPLVTVKDEFSAKLVVKNVSQLINSSYAWFVDDNEFKASRSSEFKYRLPSAKEYKLMAVLLTNECPTEDTCEPKFGIIWRRVMAVDRSVGQRKHNLTDVWSEAAHRAHRRFPEPDLQYVYSILIVSGALLLILVLIAIVIYFINRFHDQIDYKQSLIDKERLYDTKYRLYTTGL